MVRSQRSSGRDLGWAPAVRRLDGADAPACDRRRAAPRRGTPRSGPRHRCGPSLPRWPVPLVPRSCDVFGAGRRERRRGRRLHDDIERCNRTRGDRGHMEGSRVGHRHDVVARREHVRPRGGPVDAMPCSLNRWIISRTQSSEVCTRFAIAGTVLPDEEATTTIAQRHRTIDFSERPPPRRPICCNWRPSRSESRLTFTGFDMSRSKQARGTKWWTRPANVRS